MTQHLDPKSPADWLSILGLAGPWPLLFGTYR